MSLILDALKKAKELGGRKPAPPPPAALASFRFGFGRPTRAERIRQTALYIVLFAIGGAGIGYTANFVYKRMKKPATGILIAVPTPAVVSSVAAAPPPDVQAPVQSKPAPTPESKPTQVAIPLQPVLPAPQQQQPQLSVSAPPAVNPPRVSESAPPAPAPLAAPPAKIAFVPATSTPSIVEPERTPFELGVFYYKSNDYLKALAEFNKVLEKDPLNKEAYNNVGLIHLATANTLDAIKAFRQATVLDTKYEKAHNNLGLALKQAGQDADARREFELALQLNPKNVAALTNLAGLAQKAGNVGQAQSQYLKVLQIDPANAEANYGVAMIYEKLGETGKAVDHFKKFLASGSHPEIMNEVEKKIQDLSQARERRKTIATAVSGDPLPRLLARPSPFPGGQ